METAAPHRVPRDARFAEPGERKRTQADRSAKMRQRIVDATIACLVERGFTQTSTDDIVRRAGVSRGALAHHFADKADLIATATWQSWKAHLERTKPRLVEALAERRSLAEQLRIVWEETERSHTVVSEFWLAARADPTLAAAYHRVMAADPSPFSNSTPLDWVRARDDDSPLMTRFVVGCFIDGLCRAAFLNDRDTLEGIFAKFARILTLALAGMGGVEALPEPGSREGA